MMIVKLTDGSGRWFDGLKARIWIGSNKETLYRTPGYRMILCKDGSVNEVDYDTASRWLLKNGYDHKWATISDFEKLEIK